MVVTDCVSPETLKSKYVLRRLLTFLTKTSLRERLWRFVETKCMSHFKHNPDKRGTLVLEPGSSPLAEQDQHANLWANTKRSPRPARGSKRRFNGCPPGYSYVDEYDDDDEEPVFFKQERTSETMDTAQAELASVNSPYHLGTHVTDRCPSLNAGGSHESGGPPRKRPASDHRHMISCEQRATSKVCSIYWLRRSALVSLTQKSCHTFLLVLRT